MASACDSMWLRLCMCLCLSAFEHLCIYNGQWLELASFPGLFPAPVFDHLQYAKTEGEGLVNLTLRCKTIQNMTQSQRANCNG